MSFVSKVSSCCCVSWMRIVVSSDSGSEIKSVSFSLSSVSSLKCEFLVLFEK